MVSLALKIIHANQRDRKEKERQRVARSRWPSHSQNMTGMAVVECYCVIEVVGKGQF